MAIAFVAGATGLTGREVVRDLTSRGVRTVAHVRPDSASLEHWTRVFREQGAEVDTTAWEPGPMGVTLLELGPTHVFSLLGTTKKRGRMASRTGGPEETYETVDYRLSVMLLEAAEASGHEPRFVFLSAMGASPTGNEYSRVRHRVETRIREGAVPFTVARPSWIVGPREESRPGERVGSLATDVMLAIVGGVGGRQLAARYRSITSAQLARALVELAFDSKAAGRIVEADELRG